MKKKVPNSRFEIGEKVYVLLLGRYCEITDRTWNGQTWMYSFKDEAISCGEMYISRKAKDALS